MSISADSTRVVADQLGATEEREDGLVRQVNRLHLVTRGEFIGPMCLLLDAICWLGICFLMFHLRHHVFPYHVDTTRANLTDSVFVVQLAAMVMCLFIVGGYDRRTNFLSLGYMSEHCIALLAAGVVGGLVIYAGAAYSLSIRPSRSVLLSSLLAFAPLSLVTRRHLCSVLHARMARAYFVVLGAGDHARRFYQSYRGSSNRERLRFVDPDPQSRAIGQPVDADDPAAPCIEGKSFAEIKTLSGDCSGIIVAESPHSLPASLVDWLTRLRYEHTPVYTLETFYERFWRRVPVYAIDPIWPLQVENQLTNASAYSHAKRLVDVLAGCLGLVLLAPVLLVLALLIALDTRGSVIFRQTRIGRDHRPFQLCKFRTMHVRPPEEEGSLYTTTGDPRITRIGGYLRKLRLDELPQLWNVLKGDMSLIGPRAEWDRLVDKYEGTIPCYHFRHLVKPGITGWAQVNYPYGASAEDALQKLKFDLYYIRHYSLRLDAMIVLKTLHIMLWGKGQ